MSAPRWRSESFLLAVLVLGYVLDTSKALDKDKSVNSSRQSVLKAEEDFERSLHSAENVHGDTLYKGNKDENTDKYTTRQAELGNPIHNETRPKLKEDDQETRRNSLAHVTRARASCLYPSCTTPIPDHSPNCKQICPIPPPPIPCEMRCLPEPFPIRHPPPPCVMTCRPVTSTQDLCPIDPNCPHGRCAHLCPPPPCKPVCVPAPIPTEPPTPCRTTCVPVPQPPALPCKVVCERPCKPVCPPCRSRCPPSSKPCKCSTPRPPRPTCPCELEPNCGCRPRPLPPPPICPCELEPNCGCRPRPRPPPPICPCELEPNCGCRLPRPRPPPPKCPCELEPHCACRLPRPPRPICPCLGHASCSCASNEAGSNFDEADHIPGHTTDIQEPQQRSCPGLADLFGSDQCCSECEDYDR